MQCLQTTMCTTTDTAVASRAEMMAERVEARTVIFVELVQQEEQMLQQEVSWIVVFLCVVTV